MLNGDGINDDTSAIQALIDTGSSHIILPTPKKNYAISKPLVLRSGQTLQLGPTTIIRLLPGSSCNMLINDLAETEAHDIRLIGGIWDMDNNNQGANPIHPEFASDTEYPFIGLEEADEKRRAERDFYFSYRGVPIQFRDVTRLEIRDLTVRSPVTYAIRVAGIKYFTMENIRFDYEGPRPHKINMDGINLNGGCKFGVIRNIQGTTYDDLIAFNTPDGPPGSVEHIQIDGLFAENCLRFVRFLTVEERVSDITINNVMGSSYSNPIEFSQYGGRTKTSNYGKIVIRNVFVSSGPRPESDKRDLPPAPSFRFSDRINIDHLTIENFYRYETFKASPVFQIGHMVTIKNLILSNISLDKTIEGNMPLFEHNGVIDKLSAGNLDVPEDMAVTGKGKVGRLITDGSYPALKFE